MSSTPARIIAPRRVRSSSAHSATAVTMEIPTTASRYLGKNTPKTGTAPMSPRGTGSGIGSPDQTSKEESAMMKAIPSVTSTCENVRPASRRSRTRSITPPRTAMVRAPAATAVQKP